MNRFLNTTQRIELFDWLIWPKGLFFLIWFTESNTFFEHDWKIEHSEYDSKNWTLFFIRMTQRLELCLEYDSMDLNFFFNLTQRIELFFNMTQELNPFCHSKELNLLFHDAKNWTHFFWRLNWTLFWSTELNILFEHDSQNWTLFECDLKIEPDSKNWTLFLNMSQWIEPFF